MTHPFSFQINRKTSGLARVGLLTTPHGAIQTPAFVPVATKGTIKSLTPEQVEAAGAQVVLANTYHLYLEPGDERVRDHGGLHSFMNWHKPTMTDSGGFQVFSLGSAYGKELSKVTRQTDPSFLIPERSTGEELPKLATVGADGVSFRSHLDGSLHYITPEKSIEIQHNIGADIIFAFDECTSPTETRRYQEEALHRTHRWARRSLEYHLSKPESNKQALFGIVQGGRDEELRKKSAQVIGGMDFDGFGIGGSFAKEDMNTAVRWVNEILPEDKPRHLLGIGEPEDLIMGVQNGVDLFDCVAPTRNGRTGTLYTQKGKINILNAQFRDDHTPIDSQCQCYTCKTYTRAYVAHLFRAKEMTASTLATIHNIHFITHLVDSLRNALLEGSLDLFSRDFLHSYSHG